MPPHPVDVCYCHIIGAGVRNIQRLAAASDPAGVAVEADHLAFVSDLLDAYLLYQGTPQFDESLHTRYWQKVRPAYASQLGHESLAEMESPWYFLAFILGHEQDAQ